MTMFKKHGAIAAALTFSVSVLPTEAFAFSDHGANTVAEEVTLTQAEIYAIYDQVNGFDIDTAGLGAARGHDPQVRELAVMVLRDHSAVRQMSRDIAADENIAYTVDATNAAAKDHQSKLEKLKSLSDEDFDRAYLAHEKEFHTGAIAAIRSTLLPASTSEEFKAHLLAVLPGFEHHLAETIRVQKELGYE